jgi:hypothetical protein
MAKNRKTPELSDWEVRFSEDGSTVLARATSLTVYEGTVVLRDTYGAPLFAASLGAVRYVKRLEPGLDVPAAKEEPKAIREPAADPGPVETGPAGKAPRPRSGRRGK